MERRVTVLLCAECGGELSLPIIAWEHDHRHLCIGCGERGAVALAAFIERFTGAVTKHHAIRYIERAVGLKKPQVA